MAGMRLAPIVTRLQTQCPALRQVLHALSAAVPQSYPAAYVLPLSERLREDLLAGAARVYEARFGVEIMLRHAAQADSGGPAAGDLESVRESVLTALVGFDPGAGYAVIAHEGGRLISFEAGLAVWRDEFFVQFTR